MYKDALKYLRCINCGAIELNVSISRQTNGNIEKGALGCLLCKAEYKIDNSIPRFVKTEGYSESFGLEWNIHDRTQYDAYSHKMLSKTRFFEETGWKQDYPKEVVIEAGCGSGRFTEWALSTGADVLSFDLSCAVEASAKNHANNPRLFLAQADIFHLPFRPECADKLFCFGVLQHTPNPKMALSCLVHFVKRNGGQLVFDIYEKKFHMKYLVRPFLKKFPVKVLYRRCRRWVDIMWLLSKFMRNLSKKYGPKINWQLMIADYSREGVPDEKLKEWAYLDTFDMLSPKYDLPADIQEVRGWLIELKSKGSIKDFLLKRGYNGIEGKIYR
jgi:SAM-dependent methyltransferase